MARVSFSLRVAATPTDNVGGSYVRYDPTVYNNMASAEPAGEWLVDSPLGTRPYDSGLRADGFTLPPNAVADGYFEANAVCYGLVNIRYGFPITLTSEGVPSIGATPSAYEMVVVYSPNRFPISVEDGEIISRSFVAVDQDFSGFEQGRWSYFTLFIRYRGTNDDYYVNVAELEVLVPKNYESTLLLWERIPEHYRTQDELIGSSIVGTDTIVTSGGNVVAPSLGCSPSTQSIGPLFRFLSIFGFEMDRVRTLIDYLMVARNPLEASSSALSAIGWSLNALLRPKDINLARYRNILESYAYLLRQKGTVPGLKQFIRIFANCESDVDEVNKEITIYSQRVNYCYDPSNGEDALGNTPTYRSAHAAEAPTPRFSQGSFDPTTFDPDDSNTFPSPLNVAYVPGIYWVSASAGSFGTLSASVGDLIVMYGDPEAPKFGIRPANFTDNRFNNHLSLSGTVYTTNNAYASEGVTHAWFRLPSPVPIKVGDQVYVRVASIANNAPIVRGRLARTSNGAIVGEGTFVLDGPDHLASIPVNQPENLSSAEWTTCYAEVLVDFSATNASIDLSSILIERNYVGQYFDGDKTTGTWVVNPDGTPAGRDYQWSMRGAYGSASVAQGPGISVFTEEYYKTIALLQRFFPEMIPAEEYGKYNYASSVMVYDGVPGLDDVDYYYDNIPLFISDLMGWWDASDLSTITASYSGARIDDDGLALPGTSGNYASTPDSAALSITGDMEIVVRINQANYAPTSTTNFVAKWTGTTATRSYRFGFVGSSPFGRLLFEAGDGTTTFSAISSTAFTGTNNTSYWLKAVYDQDTGAGQYDVKFYYADDSATEPTSWTQLGTARTGTSIGNTVDTTTSVMFGSDSSGAAALMTGTLYRVIIRNGIAGTVVLDADFNAEAADTISFIEDSSNTATVSLTTTYGRISQWNDKSSNGRNATQATGSRQPYRRRTLNSLPAMDFIGNGFLATSAFTDNSLPYHMFAVIQSDSTAAGIRSVVSDSTSNAPQLGQSGTSYRMANTTQVLGGTINTNPHLLSIVFNGANSEFRVDGASVFTGNPGTNTYSSEVLSIGGRSDNTQLWDGVIGEVIVFSKELSDNEQSLVEQYLANKWGITL